MTPVRGLGKGLGALIPSTEGGVDEIDVDLIVPNPRQPREAIDDASVRGLSESIREHGVLQPLVVTRGDSEGVYQLVAGERRLRAARLAGLRRVPVVVREAGRGELLELALVENLQREDLSALEEAQAYRRLADEFDMTQEKIATRVGRSRTAVANSMRLLGLTPGIRDQLSAGTLSEGHARALLALRTDAARDEAMREVLKKGLNVRQTEELVRRWPDNPRAAGRRQGARDDPDTRALETKLRESVGTKVELRRNAKGRGRVVLHFYSDEELESLLGRLGVAVS